MVRQDRAHPPAMAAVMRYITPHKQDVIVVDPLRLPRWL